MASLKSVTSQYRGKMAAGYDEKREKQARWHDEHRIVGEMLTSAPGPVFDCPVGTGRFFPLYRQRKLEVIGLDSSKEMLALARKKTKKSDKITLVQGSADNVDYPDKHFGTTVCVRFLNLVEPEALRVIMRELFRITGRVMILTIRLGPEYYSNSAMATHDEKAFRSLVSRAGWSVVRDEHEMFRKGWHVMQLARKR